MDRTSKASFFIALCLLALGSLAESVTALKVTPALQPVTGASGHFRGARDDDYSTQMSTLDAKVRETAESWLTGARVSDDFENFDTAGTHSAYVPLPLLIPLMIPL